MPILASVWTSAVVPLVAALAGGAFVALVNARTQRNQYLRAQMLAAANEFAVAYAETALALRDALTRSSQERFEQGDVGISRVRLLLPRLELLFHPDSLTSREARDATGELVKAHYTITLAMNTPDSIPLVAFNELSTAENALDPVTRAAWAALTRPRRRWWTAATTRSQRLRYLDTVADAYAAIGTARRATEREKAERRRETTD